MREYLIKLYHTIGEVQKQKENEETGRIIKQMEEVRKNMAALKEENKQLRQELELLREKVGRTNLTADSNYSSK